MQHSISQTSGSQAASESGTESQANASVSVAIAAYNLNRIFSLSAIGGQPL
jgi:hypothetical protein